jgi:lipopolysaccharide export system permease protein
MRSSLKVMTTFDRYLLHRFLSSFLILFVSTFGLFVVIDGFTNVDGFQVGHEKAMDVLATMLRYYSYQSSPFFNLVGSTLAVLSVMIVFAALQKNSEFHPILAAGIPIGRLLVPIVAGMLLVSMLMMLNQEFIIPRLARELMMPRSENESKTEKVQPVYDRKTRIHIGGEGLLLSSRKLIQAEFLLPVPNIANELTSIRAEEAVYFQKTEQEPAGWYLHNVETRFEELSLTPQGKQVVRSLKESQDLFLISDVGFDQLYNKSRNYEFASIPELIRRIKNPAVGNSSLRGQILNFHSRLTRPFLNVAVIFVAVPLILRRESRSLVTNLAVCTGTLGLLMGITQVFFYCGQVNLIAPDLAAWLPVILSGTGGVWLMGFAQN